LRLDSGRLVAGYTRANHDSAKFGPSVEVLLTSDDRGVSWLKRAEAPALFGDYQVDADGAWVPGWRKV